MIDSRNIFGGTTTQSATKFLYNAFTAAGWPAVGSMSATAMGRPAASGALTANTLVDLLNESGSAGQIDQLSIYTNDTTARTIRIVITVDGTVLLDATSASIAASNSGGFWAGVGGVTGVGFNGQLPPIKYTNSIRIQYASSLTETGKFTTALAYQKVT
jgi:hypothetical protein